MLDFGRELRRIRRMRDDRLLDLAERLGKSVAFVSAIERGEKKPPKSFDEEVIAAYNLSEAEAQKIREAYDDTRSSFDLTPKTQEQRDTAGLLARKFRSLDDQKLAAIRRLLRED